jgi:hypothetical protein
MRTLIITFFIFTNHFLFSQDTSVTWIRNIDISSFEILRNKRDIPKEFYTVLEIDDINALANPSDKYSPGCTNPIRGQLNWIANQKDKWIVSITYGGKGVFTRFYFFDKQNGKLNINEMSFLEPKRSETTIGEVVVLINSGRFEFEEFQPK